MKKRLLTALVAGALMAAMVPGVAMAQGDPRLPDCYIVPPPGAAEAVRVDINVTQQAVDGMSGAGILGGCL